MVPFLLLGREIDQEPVIRRSEVRILSRLPAYEKAPFVCLFAFLVTDLDWYS